VKVLSGQELAGYIQARQAHEVRALRQAWQVQPKLAVVYVGEDAALEASVAAIEQYGADILVDVMIRRVPADTLEETVAGLNADSSVQGVFVQPSAEGAAVSPEKDIDALTEEAPFDAAMPTAILWLLAGYNIDLHQGKTVVLSAGDGHVARRLEQMLTDSEVNVVVADPDSSTIDTIQAADILISTGAARPEAFAAAKQDAVVVDVAGVGQLFVCALFENLIRAARRTVQNPA